MCNLLQLKNIVCYSFVKVKNVQNMSQVLFIMHVLFPLLPRMEKGWDIGRIDAIWL